MDKNRRENEANLSLCLTVRSDVVGNRSTQLAPFPKNTHVTIVRRTNNFAFIRKTGGVVFHLKIS